MTLDNLKIISPRPVIPSNLKGKITVFANCYVKRPSSLDESNIANVPEEAMISKGEIVVYKIYK